MHQETLREIVDELRATLAGRFAGKIFQLSPLSLAIDFGLRGEGYLFISVDPASPRLHLIKRTIRELEKQSRPHSPFAQSLRSAIGGARVELITKETNERIVKLSFSSKDELGQSQNWFLVAQLTGRSANLYLVNSKQTITQAWRTPRGAGQKPGEIYHLPVLPGKAPSKERQLERGSFPTMSATADAHYQQLEDRQGFDSLTATASAEVRKEIRRRKKLRANLKQDLISHGDPDQHKRLGDLILANLANAQRSGNKVILTDYYAENAPLIEVEIDENSSLQDAAGDCFSRYAKAKRAIEEIAARLVQIERELDELETKQARLDEAIAARDQEAVARLARVEKKSTRVKRKQNEAAKIPGTRRYRSSDGYEVLVGRAARDNDNLTFRVARPNDLWLHAGDYPGSHVIVRNSSRKEIPHRTVVEAAQLAAKFSQASEDSKVSIHYALRKYLSKPKGAAPGLVRMSSFRTITVEPGENIERL